MGEVIKMPTPENLTPEQREYWHGQAAYWCIKEEDALTALNYAHGQRSEALRMLGMIGTDNTLNEGA